jgi:Zn-dependent protease with chaperone function
MQGSIAPVTTTTGYKLGILAATGVMLLLPVLYLIMIGMVVAVVYWHLTSNYHIMGAARNGKAMVAAFMIYLLPALLGATMILFMVKPLFARPSGNQRKRYLTPESEPLLFAFVERICQAVGAPFPRRIDVDCNVNASASFRRGLLSMFSGSDLVLTIGMPLVAGMTMRQFAGVLAHEFGHFSQGAGMRLSYLVRVISFWFTRVVHERDAWDEWLANASGAIDIRIGWMLYAARACVWLTRKILWLFMMAGHITAGYLMRQMEFDADRFEARFAGSDTFESTCRRLSQLGLAYDAALDDIEMWRREGRLGDDLPMIMSARMDEFPEDLQRKLNEIIDSSETGLFDSHPADSDRIASARAEGAPGIFRLDRPAAELFAGYSILCRMVTTDKYEDALGSDFNPSEMHPSTDLLARGKRQKADQASLERLTLNCFHILRPIPLPASLPEFAPSAKQCMADIKTARDQLLALRPSYRRRFHQFDDADTLVFEGTAAIAFYRANVPIPHHEFRFPMPRREQIDQAIAQARNEMAAHGQELYPFESLVAARLERGLLLLNQPQIEMRLPNAGTWRAEAQRFLPIIYAMNAAHERLREVRNCRIAMVRLCGMMESHRENQALLEGILAGNRWLTEQVNDYRRLVADVEYPFDHAKGPVPLCDHLAPYLIDPQDIGTTFDAAGQLIDRVQELYVRILGRLASYTEQVETTLGLAPLIYPKDKGIEDRDA